MFSSRRVNNYIMRILCNRIKLLVKLDGFERQSMLTNVLFLKTESKHFFLLCVRVLKTHIFTCSYATNMMICTYYAGGSTHYYSIHLYALIMKIICTVHYRKI